MKSRELHPDIVLRPTPTGYSNDKISLEWLQHFNQHSAKTSLGAKRFLILDGYRSSVVNSINSMYIRNIRPSPYYYSIRLVILYVRQYRVHYTILYAFITAY
jgi:hypothetical protein